MRLRKNKYSVPAYYYVGLNDASGNQILEVSDASEKIRSMFFEKGLGYTEYNSYGAHTENNTIHGNDTLVYELFFTDDKVVKEVASNIKEELNLESVLVEKDYSEYSFAE